MTDRELMKWRLVGGEFILMQIFILYFHFVFMAEKNKNYQMMISDIPLMEYNNIFTGNLVWIERGIDKAIATYDLVVREIPKNFDIL